MMVLDDEFNLNCDAAAILQNKGLMQNNVITKRKEQLKLWESSDFGKTCVQRRPNHESRVKFQDRDIFLSACMSGDEDEVDELLKKGSDINIASIDGVTALHQAVIDSNTKMVEFLVERGANINAQDNEAWTPLHAAVCCGNLNITKYLYEHGSDLSIVNSDRELPIDLAESDEMRSYLEQQMALKGVDERKAREKEFSILFDNCLTWIQSGCYSDQPHPRTGGTALHVAASKGYNKLIGMLIKAGADVNIQDIEGWTPLHAAAHWGERDACRILMENGADLEAITHMGHTVLAVADKSIVEYLLNLQEKLNELRSDALQQHQNGILQDASNMSKELFMEIEHVNALPIGSHKQTSSVRRISSGERLAIKRKDELDENLTVNSIKRITPPVPVERQSLMRKELESSNIEQINLMNAQKIESPVEENEEDEWTEVTATPSSGSSESNKQEVIERQQELKETAFPKATALVKQPLINREESISSCSLTAESISTSEKSNSRSTKTKSTTTTESSTNKDESNSCSIDSAQLKEQDSSNKSYSQNSIDEEQQSTTDGVSSICSRSATPKENSTNLSHHSSEQNIQCVLAVPYSSANNDPKTTILRATETIQRLRQQLPNVQQFQRDKSHSVDNGKSLTHSMKFDLPTPPDSAPPLQARNFWNSIQCSTSSNTSRQMHPIGSTLLHQQQFNKFRQHFSAFQGPRQHTDYASSGSQSGEDSASKNKWGKSSVDQIMKSQNNMADKSKMPIVDDRSVGTAPLARITSPSESASCSSISPSPSPIVVSSADVNSSHITTRKKDRSYQQSTPPTQPISIKESEAERKAKSRIKRSTRRSTQGVTLEHIKLGEANFQHHSPKNHSQEIKKMVDQRIQQANARFNENMAAETPCSSSSSTYLTANLENQPIPKLESASNYNENCLRAHSHQKPPCKFQQLPSAISLTDELEKYKKLYAQERDENERLRRQISSLAGEARADASNTLRGVGWTGRHLMQPENKVDDTSSNEPIAYKERRVFEKRIMELEKELERNIRLQADNEKLKGENMALVRVLTKLSK